MEETTISISTDRIREMVPRLRAGDRVLLSGTIYTARDAAHKRLFERLDRGEELPLPIQDAVIYYAGPTPARPGEAIGSCGPTTAGRMDGFAPRLLDLGLAAMIGKGERSEAVCEAIERNGACYFCAVGGAGALISQRVERVEEIAFHDLGCESIKRMEVRDLPLIVAIDCVGGNLFRSGKAAYRQE